LGLNFNHTGTITDTIRSFYIDGVQQASGTWGASGTAAAHISSLFAGIGMLNVTIGSLPGDWNGDTHVNLADYVTWRKSPGTFGNDPGGYITWRENFGTAGSGGGSILGGASAVPEPAALL